MYLFLWNVLKCSREENQKYLKNKKNPWPKNWITSCSYGHCMFLPLSFCWAGTLNILQFNRRPLEITFRFPSHPSVDLFKRLPQWTGRGTASPLKPSSHPLPPFLHRTATFFICNAKPVFVVFFFLLFKRLSLNKMHPTPPPYKKTLKTEILSAPRVSASVCHPSRCTPVSSDERQPPNMWQGRGPCGKWFGKCTIYSVCPVLGFLKLLSCKPCVRLQC